MALKVNRSRVETASRSTAKPTASPRAEMQAGASRPKKAAKKHHGGPAHAIDVENPAAAKPGKPGKDKTGKAKAEKLVSSELAFKGRVFDVYRDQVIEPGGRENVREVVRHSGSVVMLGVDESGNPDDPTVILIRQYRHAAGQFLIELPAGRIDKSEAPLAAAKRELIEETGFRARRWSLLVKYFASPGFLGEWMQIYVARDLKAGDATPEEDEHIELLPTPLSKALEMIAQGRIHDGKTLIGLSLYDAERRAGRM